MYRYNKMGGGCLCCILPTKSVPCISGCLISGSLKCYLKQIFQANKAAPLCKCKLYLICLGTRKAAKSWGKPAWMISVHSQPLITIWFPLASRKQNYFCEQCFFLYRSPCLAGSLFICRQLVQPRNKSWASSFDFKKHKARKREQNAYCSLERYIVWRH